MNRRRLVGLGILFRGKSGTYRRDRTLGREDDLRPRKPQRRRQVSVHEWLVAGELFDV